MRQLFALFVPFFMLLCGSPALAQEGPWRVSEANGTVTVSNANGSRAAREGIVLRAGDNIRTAQRSSAVLVRGREFVTVRQNSSVKIPAAQRKRSVLQIIQDYGSALFNIGRQPDPHFGVETPYMAAVVKGTVFTITVSDEGAVLQVTEGAVETSTLDGGARHLIMPGVIAMVSANDNLRLVVEGDTREIIDSPARTPDANTSSPTTTGEQQSSRTTTPVQSTNVQQIETPITSAPADLAGLSNGLVTRASNPAASPITQGDTSRGAPQIAAVGRGRGGDLGKFSDASVCLVGNCDAVQPNGNGNSGGNGNGNSGGNGNGNSGGNGNGNSGGNGNGNSGGNGNGNSGGNGNGNSGGNGNGNSGGNGNGNSGGNGNGNSGGNGNGNSGGNGNGNSGGNGNGNSGGNGNGNSGGNGNGNSGGNGNGNSGGNGNGNSGGNGNGNSGGNGNGNSGGNGNGNSGGNGNGNSGGNGNGNSGGNGNGNSGGNGNGNSGGNGNGNSGGKGNGARR